MTDIEIFSESDATTMEFSNKEEDHIKVKGFAAHVGVMNKQKFTRDNLQQAAKSFVGIPITSSHSTDTDVVIGKINFADVRLDEDNNTEGLYYEGEIGSEYPEARKVERGYLSKVSMKIGYNNKVTHFCNICGKPIGECSHNFSNPDFTPIANDFYGIHVSIVTTPADKSSSITMSFSDGKVEKVKLEDYIRRISMSDNFEDKYIKLLDEFNEFKETHKEDISKLENEFKEQKADLESQTIAETEKFMNLKNDFEAMSAEKEKIETELNDYKEKFAKFEEEKLSSLRKEVIELNKEVFGNLSDDQINSFEESTLMGYKDLFLHQKEKMPSIQQAINPTDQYSQTEETPKDPIAGLMSRL